MTVPDKAQALVERLREHAVYTGKATRYTICGLLTQAADEIERLSALLSDQGRHALVDAGEVDDSTWGHVRFVHDTFKRDLEQGYKTKDKEFAVELLGKALAAPNAALAAASLPAAPVAVKELRWEDDPNPISERVDIIAFSASVAVGGVRESNSGRFRWEIVTLPGHAVSRDERSGWFDTLDAAKTEVQKHWGAWLQRATLHPAPASVVDDAMVADARRYRWLRDDRAENNRWPHIYQYPYQPNIDAEKVPQFVDGLQPRNPDNLDAAIDIAIARAAAIQPDRPGSPVEAAPAPFKYCAGCDGHDCDPEKGCAYPEPAAQDRGAVEAFQERVQPWMTACFGPEISRDRVERADRLLEEVFELLQSGGYDPARVLALRDYVWDRDKGEPSQEVGGVMVTLAAYCLAHDLDMHDAGETELARIWTKVDKIRVKQAAKPTGSALPLATPAAPYAVNGAVREALDAVKAACPAPESGTPDSHLCLIGARHLRALASLSQPTPAGSAGEDKP